MFHAYPAALSLCALAYGFGLRHAVDADHIAAIDNVTRKLMQENKRPVGVGLFFSLGHSTVVILLSLLVVQGTGYVKNHFPQFESVGGIIGTAVSVFFLLLIALVNFVIFLDVFKRFQAARKGGVRQEDALQGMLDGPGRIARTTRALFRLVGESWQMYFVGFLFGLGFDTATEIAVLGIAATQAAQQCRSGRSWCFRCCSPPACAWWTRPTASSCWAPTAGRSSSPCGSCSTTCRSRWSPFLIALLIGSLEALGMIAEKFHLDTGLWSAVHKLSDNSTAVGYGIIGLMIASWLASMVFYRMSGLDRLEEPATQPDCQ